jgi:hypothetical protein
MKRLIIIALLSLLATIIQGCSLITGEDVGEDNGSKIDMDFERMLELLPYTFVEDHDIWFGNPGRARELHGLDDLESYETIEEAIKQMPEEQQRQFVSDFVAAMLAFPPWASRPNVPPLVGFNVMMAGYLLSGDVVSPHGYFIMAGSFDTELIGQKLIEQGYTKTHYGKYSYYGIRGDFEIDLSHPLGKIVMGSMNRVAVQDNIIIISPVTADITDIFNAMAGDIPSTIDNAICRTLADSLGDVLSATLTTSERIIFADLYDQEELPEFDFTLPVDWGVLQGYEMAALGYRVEGDKNFFDIALYYEDEATAFADSQEIVKRMSSYTLYTWDEHIENVAFTECYQPGEPVVTQYGAGAVLKIPCQILPPSERWGISMVMGAVDWPLRDLLFLVPDPSLYIVY